MTATATASATFTSVDVGKVVRRVGADLAMIADSTGGWSSDQVAKYVHDIELLANEGYLRQVDVTLYSGGVEKKATRFVVNTSAAGLTNQRPGDALWPRYADPDLRIILSYTSAYGTAARARMKPKLKIGWVTSHDDISHASLSRGGDRSYASNAFGMQRMDWAA